MSERTSLSCRLYVDGPTGIEQIRQLIGDYLSNRSSRPTTIHHDLDVRYNDEFDNKRKQEFPDGFLFCRYYVEVYTDVRHVRDSTTIRDVGELLELLWDKGFAAVASCDYEAELPRRGGFNDQSVPWVSLQQ